MGSDSIAQLSAWLAATDIDLLELRGPNACLRIGPGAEELAAAALPAPSATPAPALLVRAASVGVFLHRHPLSEAPLAAIGTTVRSGTVLGLLQIGALLLPVCAPRDARITGLRIAHGKSVGYGTPLVDLDPL